MAASTPTTNDKQAEKVITIDTHYGEAEVTIRGDISNDPVILTVHDIGLNHNLCFASILSKDLSDEPTIFSRFSVVHFDVPGQQFDASELKEALDMEVLADTIELIRTRLSISKFIGLGVGAGAYLLSAYAVKYPGRVQGLVLVSGTCRASYWVEWRNNVTSSALYYITGWSALKHKLLIRYFSADTDSTLYNWYKEELDRMSLTNVSRFVTGYAARKDISEEAKKLTIPKLVLYGEGAYTHEETEEMREYLSYKDTEFVSFPDFGHLLTEECPEKLLQPITYFLNSMGYYLQSKKFERRSQ